MDWMPGRISVRNNVIAHNGPDGFNAGGVVYSECGDGERDIAGNVIVDNVGGVGGIAPFVVFYAAPQIRIANNVIARNMGTSAGGVWAMHCLMVSNTIVGNTAPGGGAVRLGGDANVLSGNLVAFNSSGISADSAVQMLSNNCVYGNSAYNYSGCSLGPGDISADPLFENLAGGDYHLRPGSPCIEAGDNSFVLPGDLDGARRIQGARVDIGAYEFPTEGGSGILYTRLEAPAAVRPGREYTAWVHYGNAGSAELPLPLLYLSNSAGVPMRIGQEGRTSTTGLALLGVSPTGTPTLPPGAEASIPITFTAPASGSVEFDLTALQSGRQHAGQLGGIRAAVSPRGHSRQ